MSEGNLYLEFDTELTDFIHELEAQAKKIKDMLPAANRGRSLLQKFEEKIASAHLTLRRRYREQRARIEKIERLAGEESFTAACRRNSEGC